MLCAFAYLDATQDYKLLRLSVSRLATVNLHVCLHSFWRPLGLEWVWELPVHDWFEIICPEMSLEPICRRLDLRTVLARTGFAPYLFHGVRSPVVDCVTPGTFFATAGWKSLYEMVLGPIPPLGQHEVVPPPIIRAIMRDNNAAWVGLVLPLDGVYRRRGR